MTHFNIFVVVKPRKNDNNKQKKLDFCTKCQKNSNGRHYTVTNFHGVKLSKSGTRSFKIKFAKLTKYHF